MFKQGPLTIQTIDCFSSTRISYDVAPPASAMTDRRSEHLTAPPYAASETQLVCGQTLSPTSMRHGEHRHTAVLAVQLCPTLPKDALCLGHMLLRSSAIVFLLQTGVMSGSKIWSRFSSANKSRKSLDHMNAAGVRRARRRVSSLLCTGK